MIKRIKKWHIVILIILGIGAYWVSQNMWIAYKPFSISNYSEVIVGKWKSTSREHIVDLFEDFSDDGNYSKGYIDEDGDESLITKGEWSIVDDILYQKLYDTADMIPFEMHHKIITMTNDALFLKHISPYGADYSLIEYYKRVK